MTTNEQTAPLPARVTVLTVDDVVTGLRATVETLRTRTGMQDLVAIVNAGLDYQLGLGAAEAFDELTDLAYLAGLPHLPCSAGGPELAAFATALEQVLDTGTLPG